MIDMSRIGDTMYRDGYRDGYEDGKVDGFNEGYTSGYVDCSANVSDRMQAAYGKIMESLDSDLEDGEG